MKRYLRTWSKRFAKQRRDPRYIFVIAVAAAVFTVCFLQVRSAGLFDSVEEPVFHFFNNLPHAWYGIMLAITQLGGLGGLPIWIAAAWYLVNKRAALTVLGAGVAAWMLAKVAKVFAHRGRPEDLLQHIHLFDGEKFGGFGFPSGHSTVSAACATVLYYQVPQRYRKYLLLAVGLVGISRMYLGAHFPLDVVGGWALGALIGGSIVMLVGVSNKGLSARQIKRYFAGRGVPVTSVRFADVDARGSRPLFVTMENGDQYFGKVFGKEEHAADWLFKIFRFFRYKNLQAEEPHFSERRNVEIEAFATLWAKQAGVRVANITDIYHFGNYWLTLQEKLSAKQLDESSRIFTRSLEDAWRQVRKLHAKRIAHRDLRAANVMLDGQGRAYLIDFGFAEVSARPQRLHMDNAELLMSMTLVVGTKRTVAAARKILEDKTLRGSLPYLQQAVFSGATTKSLRQNKHLLNELKEEICKGIGLEGEVEQADILRINRRRLLNLLLFAVFVYIVLPQLGVFRQAIAGTHIASAPWFVPLTVASLLTYVFTGLIYVSLASVPLKISDASLVQLAASFVSKIMPGGLGSTSLNAKYLTKAGMEALEASAVIAGQAFIGFVMFVVPLGLFLVLNGTNVLHMVHFHVAAIIVYIVLASLFVSATILTFVPKLRELVLRRAEAFVQNVRDITTSPRELSYAAASSLAVTAAYVFCLYAALQSIGVHVGATQVIVAYALAVLAKSAVPTPGGLGPVEAALIGTLVSFGVDKAAAVSAVLIYRLATFWIPVPLSLLAYRIIDRKKLI